MFASTLAFAGLVFAYLRGLTFRNFATCNFIFNCRGPKTVFTLATTEV